MIQQKFVIKDGVLLRIREERIVDRTKLFKYNPNLRVLADDIRRSRKDEHFENYLLKAEELFAIISTDMPNSFILRAFSRLASALPLLKEVSMML
jgi:hypothetical protein